MTSLIMNHARRYCIASLATSMSTSSLIAPSVGMIGRSSSLTSSSSSSSSRYSTRSYLSMRAASPSSSASDAADGASSTLVTKKPRKLSPLAIAERELRAAERRERQSDKAYRDVEQKVKRFQIAQRKTRARESANKKAEARAAINARIKYRTTLRSQINKYNQIESAKKQKLNHDTDVAYVYALDRHRTSLARHATAVSAYARHLANPLSLKRPLNAYASFVKQHYVTTLSNMKAAAGEGVDVKPTLVMKEVAKLWSATSAEDKDRLNKARQLLLDQYHEEKAKQDKELPPRAPLTAFLRFFSANSARVARSLPEGTPLIPAASRLIAAEWNALPAAEKDMLLSQSRAAAAAHKDNLAAWALTHPRDESGKPIKPSAPSKTAIKNELSMKREQQSMKRFERSVANQEKIDAQVKAQADADAKAQDDAAKQ